MTKPCVIIGVTGGIAAFKACQLVSDGIKKGWDIHVIMTKNATQFIHPLTFETLTQHNVSIDTFERNFQYDVEHISLAKKADCFVVVPATANFIAKAVSGIADDMLTTTFLAFNGPKIICPAMNSQMLSNPITQKNIQCAKNLNMTIVHSVEGKLACGDIGDGKLADISTIIDYIEMALQKDKPLFGKKVLISAGPTQEAMDPVRYVTNHSSGKMGYAIAKVARNLGAEVTLVSGPVTLQPINNIVTFNVKTAEEMFNAIKDHYQQADIIIKAAAVADYTIAKPATQKLKKGNDDLTVQFQRTTDILAYLGQNKLPHQRLIGFAMETENLIENARKKCINKNCDFIVANHLLEEGAGFKTDTNRVTFVFPNESKELPLCLKEEVAYELFKQCYDKGETTYVTNN